MSRRKRKVSWEESLPEEVPEKPNLIITIRCTAIDVEVNSAVYSKEDEKRIREIVDHMRNHIYIDRTYVVFEGNRWGTRFIIEDKWYKLNRLILETDFGNRAGEKINDFLLGTMEVLAETYLYTILAMYGYDPDYIELSFPENCNIGADYVYDERTSWDF